MVSKIPAKVIEIYKKFLSNNYQIYFVGGCVRDLLLQKISKDWDLTTNATPEEILKLFPDGFYDNTFGTVGIPIEEENKYIVEVTTFRTEREYTDMRHPTNVMWGETIEEDLQRRDLTINAMALKLNGDNLDTIIDPFNGQDDIKNKIIRAVGDPNLRFKEDALRLMRAIRFATQLSFSIEEKTLQAIQEDSSLLSHIAWERIRDELLKILASDYPYDGIMLLYNTNLLSYILPELIEGVGVSQLRPARGFVLANTL